MPQNNGYTIYHSDGSAKDVAPEHTPIIDKLAADNSDESINNFYDPNHIPSNTVKITKNNVTKDVDVRSKEYKELYNSGHLTSYDDKTNTYYATPLKEVTITAEAPQWLKNKRQFEKEYTKDKFIDETMPKFSRSMGISSTNMNPNNITEYNSRINDKVVENIFKRNPTFDTDYSNDRLEALQGFSQKELELIKNSKYASKIEPSIWSKFEQGLLSVGNAGSPVTFKNPSLSQEEAKKENNPLNILQPLSVPSKMVQSAYKDNYSLKDALAGKQNNASVGEDLITDPLNLVGLGVWGKLNKADKLVDLYRIEEQGAKTFAQLSVENKIPKVFNTPEVLARKANEEKHFGQWFTNNIDDINWYAKDREFTNPQIYHVQVPESKLKSFKEFDESLSRAKDREFILPNSVKNSGKIYNGLDEFNQSVKGLSKESQIEKLTEQASRFDHSLKNNPNLAWRDEGDGLLKPYNTKSGKLLQEEYIDNLKSYYDSPEFKRIMQEHYPDVNIETYKQKTLQNLESHITYNLKETGVNLGVYKDKSSSNAAYIPGYTPTFKQKVNNANTNLYSSNDRGKSYLKVFDATDHELSHQRTNSDELLPNFLNDEFLKKNVRPEINDELNIVKDLGENSVQYDNFNYQTKPTEFEVRLRQLKEDLKSNEINDYFNKPVTEGHINKLLKPELEQTKQETDLFTTFNKTYREAKNKGIKDIELQKIKDKYFEDLDKIKVKQHNISGDSQDLLKYYTPKFLSDMANKLPAAIPFYLYLQNQNKETK